MSVAVFQTVYIAQITTPLPLVIERQVVNPNNTVLGPPHIDGVGYNDLLFPRATYAYRHTMYNDCELDEQGICIKRGEVSSHDQNPYWHINYVGEVMDVTQLLTLPHVPYRLYETFLLSNTKKVIRTTMGRFFPYTKKQASVISPLDMRYEESPILCQPT